MGAEVDAGLPSQGGPARGDLPPAGLAHFQTFLQHLEREDGVWLLQQLEAHKAAEAAVSAGEGHAPPLVLQFEFYDDLMATGDMDMALELAENQGGAKWSYASHLQSISARCHPAAPGQTMV